MTMLAVKKKAEFQNRKLYERPINGHSRKRNRRRIALDITDEAFENLHTVAKFENRSLSAVARDFITWGFDEYDKVLTLRRDRPTLSGN